MRILIQGYNTCCQNKAGGVQTKIRSYVEALKKRKSLEVKYFDMFMDKLVDYDVIHFFKLTTEHLALMQYAKSAGIKIVLSSIVPNNGKAAIQANLLLGSILPIHPVQQLSQWALQMCDAIIPETRLEAQFIYEAYGINKDKMKIIPNGISNSLFGGNPVLAMREFGIKEKVILLPALIDRNKNQLSVICALRDTDIPVLIMGGCNPSAVAYMEQCKREATDNIKFTGWVQHGSPLWASCYALAKVVTLPSFHEIYGNSLFEGCAAGANVVVSNVLPIAEWGLDKLILSINPYSVRDIREKLIKAYNTPVSPELSVRVRNEYTWDAIVDKHLEVYQSVL